MLMFYGAPKFHDQFWAGHPSSQEETKVFVKYALEVLMHALAILQALQWQMIIDPI